MDQLRPAVMILLLADARHRGGLPAGRDGIAQVVFPSQANGSLIVRDGKVVGSSLIGQPFDDPKYFWGRLSATAPFPYNAGASSGSNLGPLNPALSRRRPGTDRRPARGRPRRTRRPCPWTSSTASGSGLDPHISPAAASTRCAGWPRRASSTRPRPAARRAAHRGPAARRPRRATGERAAAEPGARRRMPELTQDAVQPGSRASWPRPAPAGRASRGMAER